MLKCGKIQNLKRYLYRYMKVLVCMKFTALRNNSIKDCETLINRFFWPLCIKLIEVIFNLETEY